ncbi:MAG: DUF4214 domain-containing protein [Microthrixaceae bacterium]
MTLTPVVNQEPSPVRRLIRTSTLFSAVALVATTLVVVVGPARPAGAQTGTRRVNVTISCSPTTVTVGTTTTCSVIVDDNQAGNRVPTGTVTFSVTTSGRTTSFAEVKPCVLAQRNADEAECAGANAGQIVMLGTGTLTLRADYSGSSVHVPGNVSRSITVNSSSNPVTYAPAYATSAGKGNTVKVYGAACAASGGQWGGFGSAERDPAAASTPTDLQQYLATSTRGDGALFWTTTIPAEAFVGTTYARFYCATAPVTSIGDARITWLGPLITYTVLATPISTNAVPQVALPRSFAVRLPFVGRIASPVVAPRQISAGGVVVNQDPDALPGKDLVGLTGDVSARLKARVDRVESASGRLTRLTLAALGRMPTRAFVDTWTPSVTAGDMSGLQKALAASTEFRTTFGALATADFVRTVYARVLGASPTSAELDAAVQRLDSAAVSRVAYLGEMVERPQHVAATAARTYVLAAFTELSTIIPNQGALDRFTGELTDLRSEVQVVEDIALTRAAPATWLAAGVNTARI